VYDTDVALHQIAYARLLAANVKAARARLGLTQASVAKRMKALGFPWYQQTCGAVGLSLALETSMDLLTLPPRAEEVTLPGGQVVELPGAGEVVRLFGADLPRVWSRNWWDGDTPKFPTSDNRKETNGTHDQDD
jgi:hypothetical protein